MFGSLNCKSILGLGLAASLLLSLPRFVPAQENERDALYAELAREAAALERYTNLLKNVIRVVKPTVLHIEAKRRETDKFNRTREVEEAGAGVILRYGDKFYGVTNRHVIKNTPNAKIDIKLADGRVIHPVSVVSDPGTDVAVLELSAARLIPAKIGDSDKLEMGDFVVAVGSPFGLNHSVTYGIISARGRRDLELGEEGVKYQDFFQTDAAINPGNSGGPLMNLRGELVGINTAIASNSGGNEGIGFTIPINMVSVVVRQLIEHGHVVRAFLGVNLDSKYTAEMAASLGLPTADGARVSGVTPNSPAQEASLEVGDVILTFNGIEIEDDNDLVNRVSLTPVGTDVPMIVFRGGKQMTINVKLRDRKTFERR